jgi:hypothetical protein
MVAWWLASRKRVQKERRKTFDSVFALVSWCLWLQRNSRVFNYRRVSANALADLIWAKGEMWCRAKLLRAVAVVGRVGFKSLGRLSET